MWPRPSAASKVARLYRYAGMQASVRICRFVGACGVQPCGRSQMCTCTLEGASARLLILHVPAAWPRCRKREVHVFGAQSVRADQTRAWRPVAQGTPTLRSSA